MEGLESFFSVSEQLKLFLLSCLSGIPVGILFDIFRAIRVIFPHGRVLVAIEDILFFILYSIFLMCFTVSAARSEFRFYFLIGNLIGFTLYFFTLGNASLAIIKVIVITIKKILCFIFKPICRKFVLIFKKTRNFFVGTLQKLKMDKKNM